MGISIWIVWMSCLYIDSVMDSMDFGYSDGTISFEISGYRIIYMIDSKVRRSYKRSFVRSVGLLSRIIARTSMIFFAVGVSWRSFTLIISSKYYNTFSISVVSFEYPSLLAGLVHHERSRTIGVRGGCIISSMILMIIMSGSSSCWSSWSMISMIRKVDISLPLNI